MPTAITHFEITELPDPNVIESLINAVPIVINTQYPIADQNLLTFERTAAFASRAVSTAFKYKNHDTPNLLESNEAYGSLVWLSVASTPTSANVQQTILNDDVVNLLTELPFNDAVEYIIIVSMTGVRNLIVNGAPAYIGQKISLINLFYSNFTAESLGGGDPYFELTYNVGKGVTTEITDYTLTLDIIALGTLILFSGPTVNNYTEDIDTGGGVIVNYPIIDEFTEIKVQTSHAYGVARVVIDIDSAFLALNAYNLVYVDYNGNQFEEGANIIINADINLDKNGEAVIGIRNYIVVDTGVSKLGDVTLTLTEVNGDPLLVDGVQVQQILTNL